jgi:hypothetical protein
MRVVAADFDETFAAKEKTLDKHPAVCEPGECFVGSYAPVSKPGVPGKWNNNSYFLQDTRRHEVVGAVPVRSRDFKFK